MLRSYAGLLPALLLLAACAEGEGTIAVTAYGESYIEQGVPAAEMADGWAVTFESFVVTFADIQLAGAELADPAPVDLAVASGAQGQPLGELLAPEGDHTGAAFTIARMDLQGTATLGTTTKTFAWQFDDPAPYTGCATTTSVTDGGRATFQITVHADHLLADSLVAAEPELRFQALADADTDDDGAIIQSELAGVDIGAYDPGSEGGIDDLWAWLVAQSHTLGHVDGEGHCESPGIHH